VRQQEQQRSGGQGGASAAEQPKLEADQQEPADERHEGEAAAVGADGSEDEKGGVGQDQRAEAAEQEAALRSSLASLLSPRSRRISSAVGRGNRHLQEVKHDGRPDEEEQANGAGVDGE
jgi:hypothetical protein